MNAKTAAVCAVVLTLAGCAAAPAAAGPRDAATLTRSVVNTAPITFAVVGDSITNWHDEYRAARSWVTYTTAPNVTFTGEGVGENGSDTSMQLSLIRPVSADVLVMMVGYNNFSLDMTTEQGLSDIRAMVAVACPSWVVLAAVPPRTLDTPAAEVAVWNDAMRDLALVEGWGWVDPWVDVRTVDGEWGGLWLTEDWAHPAPSAAALAGPHVVEALDAVVQTDGLLSCR